MKTLLATVVIASFLSVSCSDPTPPAPPAPVSPAVVAPEALPVYTKPITVPALIPAPAPAQAKAAVKKPKASAEAAAYAKAKANSERAACLKKAVDIKIAFDIQQGVISDKGNVRDLSPPNRARGSLQRTPSSSDASCVVVY